MKKIILFVAVVFLFALPEFSNSAFSAPYFNIKINLNAKGGDGEFTFHITGGNPGVYASQDANIQTVNGVGSFNYSGNSGNGDTYLIVQDNLPGWQFVGMTCVSNDNPADQFSNISNGVAIIAYPYSTITCNVTDVKQNFKVPLLIVPGIMGTNIQKGDGALWVDVGRMLRTPGDSFMDPLAFQSDGSPLDTSLSLGSVIDKAGTLDYTKSLVDDLSASGYTPGVDLYFFPYDWRRDINDVAAVDDPALKNPSLKQIIDQILLSTGANKIDIVAHSQGGLVVKRLLYDLPEYQNKINKLVFVGTPNLGAPKAAKVLLYGDTMGVEFLGMGLAPSEVQKISQNMPAVYELLPSAEYFNHSSGYLGLLDQNISLIGGEDYNFPQTGQALKDAGENYSLIDKAAQFHSGDYDNFNFSNSGIKVYNILGCQSGTTGQVLMGSDGKYHINYVAGDGTVPAFSAANIGGAQTYYSLDSGDLHATMLTRDGIRQQIENILTDGDLPTPNITQDQSQCQYNGQEVSVHSPVTLEIYDENGNHVGPNSDGSFDYNIDGVQYDILGHDKFAFLPPGHQYSVKLLATDSGSFSFDSSPIVAGQIISTAHYDAVPISTSSTAEISLNAKNNQNILLDSNGDGIVDATMPPSSIIDGLQSEDLVPPISTSTLGGTVGQPGFYRSDVQVNLSAVDPVIGGDSGRTSGVMKINYKLDGDTTYKTYLGSINLITEGVHRLMFFATDKAGNNEAPNTVSLTVDKTPPELITQFSPVLRDLQFTATGTPPIKIMDQDDIITATDAAGNQTVLALQSKNRKFIMKADIKSLAYNGKPADISKNLLHFDWLFDQKGNLQVLTQQVQAKNNFNILAVSGPNNTLIVGKDQNGKIAKLASGLDLLKIFTCKGDLGWSY